MGFWVVAINIAFCSLGGPVLNLLRMGENQNILFILVHEAAVRTICDATKKKQLKANRHTAEVERGFSAQNLICTS